MGQKRYISCLARQGTCLAIHFHTGSRMLFIEPRNWNKVAAFYTDHTSSIRIFNCLYFPDVTLKNYWRWRPHTFSASPIDCTPLDSHMRVCRHHTGASSIFSIGSLSTGGGTGWQCWLLLSKIYNHEEKVQSFLSDVTSCLCFHLGFTDERLNNGSLLLGSGFTDWRCFSLTNLLM